MPSSHECLSQLLVIEELKAAEDWTFIEIVCSEAIAQDAFNDKFFVYRGITRTHPHRLVETLEDFDLANSIEPLNRTAILGRARALLNIGLVDVAEDAVTSILECDIQDRDAHKLLEDVAVTKFRAIIAKGLTSDGRTKHFELCVLENFAIEEFNMETSQYGFELALRKEFQLSANIYPIKDSLF